MRKTILFGTVLFSISTLATAQNQSPPRTQRIVPPATTQTPLPAKEPGTTNVPVASVEDWKGAPSGREVTVGGMVGIGNLDRDAGFGILGTLGKKIVPDGWLADVNDEVFLEAAIGPVFNSGETSGVSGQDFLFFSTHLRWDFIKDSSWTIYALGGIAGDLTTTDAPAGSSGLALYPRFGAGAFYNLTATLSVRGEVSHEWVGLGLSLSL